MAKGKLDMAKAIVPQSIQDKITSVGKDIHSRAFPGEVAAPEATKELAKQAAAAIAIARALA
jgi:hypothetical protein